MSDLTAALVAARKKMTDPKLAGENPHFGSRFVPRDEALAVIVPKLLEQGVFVTQGVSEGFLRTAVHKGEEMAVLCEYPVPAISDPQKYLAALTYASRGSLMLAFSLAGEPDDDGNTAAKGQQQANAEAEAEFARMATLAKDNSTGDAVMAALGVAKKADAKAAFVAADEATRQEVWAAANGLEKP